MIGATPQPMFGGDPMAAVAHTLWVFDLGSSTHLTSNQIQTLSSSLSTLNTVFLEPCVDNTTVSSATATLASGSVISPATFDAVVFLVADTSHSVIAKSGIDISATINNANKLGLTVGPMSGGTISEVYWGRCMNDTEVAGAIFHEAAHLKSNNDPGMHTFASPNIGGSGVRVLAATGYRGNQTPSWDDCIYYTNHVPNKVTLRTTSP